MLVSRRPRSSETVHDPVEYVWPSSGLGRLDNALRSGRRPFSMRVNAICSVCSQAFYVRPYLFALGRGHFCSRACCYAATPEERFWEKVNKNGPIFRQRPDLGPCWSWLGRLRNGYGAFSVKGGRQVRAHRWSYEKSFGAVPDGLELDHLCRNRICVNPSHLEAVTHRVNTLRSDNACALHARQTHCMRGHPFDEANTYVRPNGGGRTCRACYARAKTAKPRVQRSGTKAGEQT